MAAVARAFPSFGHCVVFGKPDAEPNAIAVLERLPAAFRGRIYWLRADTSHVEPWPVLREAPDRIRLVRHRSLRGVLLLLTARLSFFTQDPYGPLPASGRRLRVNLWHGDGAKRTKSASHVVPRDVSADLLVSGVEAFAPSKAADLGLPATSIRLVGNPRLDLLRRGRADLRARLAQPDEKLVLWVPTFRARAAEGARYRGWQDTAPLSEDTDAQAFMEAISAGTTGVRVYVKPHPKDADDWSRAGVPVLDERQLLGAGCSWYEVLGLADATIADYSSVWLDYLTLDRPIAFFVPDFDAYERQRGFKIDDLREALPGPVLEGPADARQFLVDVSQARDPWVAQRARSRARLGLAQPPSAVGALFEAVAREVDARGIDLRFVRPT